MRFELSYFVVVAAFLQLGVCPRANAGTASELLGRCGHALGRLVSAWDSAKAKLGISNRFRGAGEYSVAFGPDFIADLRALGPEDVVVEFGSGEGHFAQQVFLGGEVQAGQLFDVTGYYAMGRDLVIPLHRYFRLPVQAHEALVELSATSLASKPKYIGFSRDGLSGVFSDRVSFIIGDVESPSTLQSPPMKDLHGVGVMIDEFGVFSYAKSPSAYLNRALNRLRVGGVFYLNFPPNHNRLWNGLRRWEMLDAFFHRIEGVDIKPRTFPLVETSGGEHSRIKGDRPLRQGVLNQGGVWRLERVSPHPVRVPILRSQVGLPLSQGVSFRTFDMSRDGYEPLELEASGP